MDHRAIRREYIVGGRGLDDLLGGRGNDIIEAADGGEEWLDCGSGDADRASVDQGDQVSNCEFVNGERTN